MANGIIQTLYTCTFGGAKSTLNNLLITGTEVKYVIIKPDNKNTNEPKKIQNSRE